MNLTICTTYYHLYVTLLKRLVWGQETDLVICDDIPTGRVLVKRLRGTGLFGRVWYVEQHRLPEEFGRGRLDRVLFQHRRRYRLLRPLLPFQLEDYQEIYIYHDGTALGMFLNDARCPYHLVEDALNFYQRLQDTPQAQLLRPHDWKFRIRKLLNSGYFPLGESKYVKDIEVNENRNLQIVGKPIVELPRDAMEQKLTPTQRQLIFQIFGQPELPEMGAGTALLLTEPLYSDGVCTTLEEQVEIYQKMLKSLQAEGFQVVIKPHPRDFEDYTGLGAQVLDKNFPVELLAHLIKAPLGCAAAVSSSAVFTIQAEEKNVLASGHIKPCKIKR